MFENFNMYKNRKLTDLFIFVVLMNENLYFPLLPNVKFKNLVTKPKNGGNVTSNI